MKNWKMAAGVAALVAAAGAGAAFAPVAHGQAVAPRAAEIISLAAGARIGVSVSDLDPADSKTGQAGGVRIDEVSEDSPASKAGFRVGDVVVEFDGERIRSVRQFTRLVQETVPGRRVQAVVLRDGQRTTVTVEPSDRSAEWFERDGARIFNERWRITPPVIARPSRPGTTVIPDIESLIWRGRHTLGITVGDLSPQLAEYFGTKEGVLVNSVQDDSAAKTAGVKAGDVITNINGRAVETASELRRELQQLRPGDEFTLTVMRDRKSMTLKGKAEERTPSRRTYRSIL